MADHPPFVSGSQGSAPSYPEQDPSYTQGGAPGGRWPTSGAPQSISGGMPMTTGGFSPSPENAPLPAPGTDNGLAKYPGAR